MCVCVCDMHNFSACVLYHAIFKWLKILCFETLEVNFRKKNCRILLPIKRVSKCSKVFMGNFFL